MSTEQRSTGTSTDAAKGEQNLARQLAAENLNGLTLAEAFRTHVVGDSEVKAIGQRLIEMRPSRSAIFVEGRFTGPLNDFHWPLHASADAIAYGFVDSCYIDLSRPLPEPSELEIQVAWVIADRMRSLVDLLSNDEIVASGTYSATGIQAPIGSGQWTRQDLALDVENSALCEIRGGRPFPVWTGIRLRLPAQPSQQSSSPSVSMKARTQIQTRNNCRLECAAWLSSTMSDPCVVSRTNAALWAEAKRKWPNKLSEREFHKCRAEILTSLSEEQRYLWSRPGPKRRSPQF